MTTHRTLKQYKLGVRYYFILVTISLESLLVSAPRSYNSVLAFNFEIGTTVYVTSLMSGRTLHTDFDFEILRPKRTYPPADWIHWSSGDERVPRSVSDRPHARGTF